MRIPILLVAGSIAFGILYAMLDSLVESVVFHPTPGADLSPETIGVVGEDVFLTTDDGVKIHAFYLPGTSAEGRPDRALLFLHGNAGNASHRLPLAADLMRLGCAVLVLDYRGYGLSEGRPSEQGSYRIS